MRALVTGATGFIGSHLVESLVREAFDVSCLVRNSSSKRYFEGLNIRTVPGDCRDRSSLVEAVKDVDYVFHLAGLTKACTEEEFSGVNVSGTRNIIQAVAENNPGIKRFVHISSLAAAGPSPQGIPLNEECQPKPVSLYGRTKLAGELAVYRYRDRLPVTIIRPPAVYGPRDRDFLVFYKMVRAGIVPYWGKCSYSFIFVDDLVDGIMLCARSERAIGEIFNLSDGSVYTTDDIIDAVAGAMQKNPLRLALPRFIMPVIGFLAERIKGASIINSDKIREMQHPHWVCDMNKAAIRLGFEPKVKMKEGARWTADWYRIHQWL
jgi:nucleoside-diphosphate-sugar epimerase